MNISLILGMVVFVIMFQSLSGLTLGLNVGDNHLFNLIAQFQSLSGLTLGLNIIDAMAKAWASCFNPFQG